MYIAAQCSPTGTAGLLCSYPLSFLKQFVFDAISPGASFPPFLLTVPVKKRGTIPTTTSSVSLSQHLPFPTHFPLASQLQVQLSLRDDDERWVSWVPACLPFGLQAGSGPFQSGHLSSLGTCQCHHSAGPSVRYCPERTAQLSFEQMQHHSLYRVGSEPLTDMASTTLNN